MKYQNQNQNAINTLLARLVTSGFSLRAALYAALLCISLGLGFSPVQAEDGVPMAASTTVSINSANAETLASVLNGVGNSRAKDIVLYREQYGPFGSVDDLAEVKGIGKSTLEKNRARITLE